MKNAKNSIQTMAISALLCAMSLVIPMIFPKIYLEPMSFTLACHVPTFLAIFISPAVAICTCIASAIGFFFTTTPVVALRALSHIGFVIVGTLMLKKNKDLLKTAKGVAVFGGITAIVHAVLECLVVTLFYFGGAMNGNWYANGYIVSVLLLVGLGTVAHSIVDYIIAIAVWKPVEMIIKIPVAGSMKKKTV